MSEGEAFRIVAHLDRFRVVRRAAANRPVIGFLRHVASVARPHRKEAIEFLKDGLRTPETAAGENGNTFAFRQRIKFGIRKIAWFDA